MSETTEMTPVTESASVGRWSTNRLVAIAVMVGLASAGLSAAAVMGARPVKDVNPLLGPPTYQTGIGANGANGVARSEGKLSSAAADAMYPYWGSAVLLPGAGLPDVAGTATAYRFDPSKVVARELALKLAKALGVDVQVTVNEDGSASGSSAQGGGVWVSTDGLASFNGYTGAGFTGCAVPIGMEAPKTTVQGGPAPVGTAIGTPDSSGSTGAVSGGAVPIGMDTRNGSASGGVVPGSSGTGSGVGVSTSTDTPGAATPLPCGEDAPAVATALAQAKALFGKLGLDVANAKFATVVNGSAVSVTAYPVVQGITLESAWYAEVTKDGVVSVSGFAATLVAAGDYPTIGAKAAVVRSQSQLWSAFGPTGVYAQGPGAYPMVAGASNSAATSQRAARPTQGGLAAIVRPVHTVTVTKAKAALTQYWEQGGTVWLLPAWHVSGADDAVWSVISIASEYSVAMEPEYSMMARAAA